MTIHTISVPDDIDQTQVSATIEENHVRLRVVARYPNDVFQGEDVGFTIYRWQMDCLVERYLELKTQD